MKVLVGDTRDSAYLDILKQKKWGRMCVEFDPDPYMFEPWGFDNKAFSPWLVAGKPIGLSYDDWLILWDSDDFIERLERAKLACCDPYIAVCPDIPASRDSLEFSLFWRSQVPNDWPWYLAVQDGMLESEVIDCLHLFTGIFLGGSDKFKQTAQYWCQLAHSFGKKFHYGRAGTIAKLRHIVSVLILAIRHFRCGHESVWICLLRSGKD